MENSGLDNIRWVVEDALKFVKREAKRGNKYNGLILDPPAYGHGPDGEKWKLDELLFELLTECSKIVAPKDAFMVLNLYSNGYSAMLADTAVRTAFDLLPGKDSDVSLTCGELMLKDSFNKNIPLSVFSRLRR
jgi:23S rRNA (cytosine1962-C5)-methyltransferase